MFNLGPLELIVIFVVALLVFGPNKLPEIGRQVGRAIREFRQFQSSFQTELRDVLEDPSPSPLVPGAAQAAEPTPAGAESAPAGKVAEAQPAPEVPAPASPDEGGATPAESTGGEGGTTTAPHKGPG